MKILQIGAAKSGNYWVYKIIESIMRQQQLPRPSFIQNHPIYPLAQTWPLSHEEQASIDVLDIEPQGCFYRISNIFRMPIPDLDQHLQQCSHVWSHSPYVAAASSVLPKFDKVVYIVRDPRDMAISMARFAFTPYMQTFYPVAESSRQAYLQKRLSNMVRHWTRHVGGYLAQAEQLNIHFLFYERLLVAFDAELAALLDYLDITADKSLLAKVRQDVDFATMQRQSPHHVRRGKMNQWVERLSRRQKAESVAIAGSLMALLDYPQTAVSDQLPSFPTNLDPQQIESALAMANRQAFWLRLKGFLRRP